ESGLAWHSRDPVGRRPPATLEIHLARALALSSRAVAVLAAHDLTKAFGTRRVLDGVSLSIATAERVGLVGRNGSGKSTLARLLAGVDAPDEGTVSKGRGVSIGYLAQDPSFDPERTAREIVLAGLSAWMAAKARHDAAGDAITRNAGTLEDLLRAQAEAAL